MKNVYNKITTIHSKSQRYVERSKMFDKIHEMDIFSFHCPSFPFKTASRNFLRLSSWKFHFHMKNIQFYAKIFMKLYFSNQNLLPAPNSTQCHVNSRNINFYLLSVANSVFWGWDFLIINYLHCSEHRSLRKLLNTTFRGGIQKNIIFYLRLIEELQ